MSHKHSSAEVDIRRRETKQLTPAIALLVQLRVYINGHDQDSLTSGLTNDSRHRNIGDDGNGTVGGRLCSLVGWLGYGGNLTWRKQEYFIEHVLGVPISQGSLAKMQHWFAESLEPSYQQWLSYIKQPGVRCVDETTYCIDGIKYWLWVATSDSVCALLLAPTRSCAELEKLLGEEFEGILSSDCFSAYSPQRAAAKQKCLAHLERDLEALKTSRFVGNRDFSERVGQVLWTARCT